MVTYLDWLLPIKSNDHIITWFLEVTWQTKNHYVSTTTMSMATKCSRMMTYLEWLLPLKSHDHTITWSCKITRQTKITIYSLTQSLWLSILAERRYKKGVPFHKVTRSFDHMVLQGLVKYFSCCITTTTRPTAFHFWKSGELL